MQIIKGNPDEDNLCELIDREFTRYAGKFDIHVGYNDFCFVAKDDEKLTKYFLIKHIGNG